MDDNNGRPVDKEVDDETLIEDERPMEDDTVPTTEEIYCVSHFKDQIVYGGNDHVCTIFDITEGHPVSLIEGFSDSVVFCRQLDHPLNHPLDHPLNHPLDHPLDHLLVCTIDGTISLLTREDIIQSEKIDEDITFVDVVEDRILVGGSLGTVYIFSLDLSSHNVYLGHASEIHKVFYANSTVYALSSDQFIAFDEFTFQQKYRKNLRGATCFEGIPGTDIFCVGKEGELVILKNGFLLNKFEIEGTPECITFAYDHFIVGGSFPCLILINTKMNMREYKLRLEIEGSTKIQAIGQSRVALSTMCGLVGVGDIRKDDSFSFMSSNVGTVFDFQYVDGRFYAGGLYGFDVAEIEN